MITGQKPIVTRAKKSIASFKLREEQAIGTKVTLRGDRAWEFFDRLLSLAIPRIRDFRGLSPHSFDGHGNYTFGINDQLIFPEIDYDKIDARVVSTSRSSPPPRTTSRDAHSCALTASLQAGESIVMAKKALRIKQQKTPKFSTRAYTRCERCGRPRSVYRKFGLCRICLRVMVHAGEVPGVTKASW